LFFSLKSIHPLPGQTKTSLPDPIEQSVFSLDHILLWEILIGFLHVLQERAGLVAPWIMGCVAFLALEAVAMVYSNVLRDHVNRVRLFYLCLFYLFLFAPRKGLEGLVCIGKAYQLNPTTFFCVFGTGRSIFGRKGCLYYLSPFRLKSSFPPRKPVFNTRMHLGFQLVQINLIKL